jgi:hypothetical protein
VFTRIQLFAGLSLPPRGSGVKREERSRANEIKGYGTAQAEPKVGAGELAIWAYTEVPERVYRALMKSIRSGRPSSSVLTSNCYLLKAKLLI